MGYRIKHYNECLLVETEEGVVLQIFSAVYCHLRQCFTSVHTL